MNQPYEKIWITEHQGCQNIQANICIAKNSLSILESCSTQMASMDDPAIFYLNLK